MGSELNNGERDGVCIRAHRVHHGQRKFRVTTIDFQFCVTVDATPHDAHYYSIGDNQNAPIDRADAGDERDDCDGDVADDREPGKDKKEFSGERLNR